MRRRRWVKGQRSCVEVNGHLLGSKVTCWGQSIRSKAISHAIQVYLPLLLEYFSESELRKLTHHVLELHGIPESATLGDKVQEKGQNHSWTFPYECDHWLHPLAVSPSLLTLPTELSLQILSYLSPQDLLHLVPLHSTLYHLARDPALWQHLHPVRWAAGHWEFFKPPPVNDQVGAWCVLGGGGAWSGGGVVC